MGDTKKVVEVECLLRNGREVFLVLDLGRDQISEVEGVVTYTRNPEPGLIEETLIPRAEVAYLKQTTREVKEDFPNYRTLGRESAVQAS